MSDFIFSISVTFPIFLVMVIMCILCFGVFSCTTYLNQQSKTYVNIGDANLVQLDEPEDDAPAMRIQTTEGNIVAELYPEPRGLHLLLRPYDA